MAYHWGAERRQGNDRRVAGGVAYAGPERRVAERRQHPPEGRSWFGWVVIALALFVTVDAAYWDGFYRRALVAELNGYATVTREWGANVWHFQ